MAPSLADIGPTASTLAHGGSLPEILLSLSYNELTGRLMVEVVKGSHFRNLAAAKTPGKPVENKWKGSLINYFLFIAEAKKYIYLYLPFLLPTNQLTYLPFF